MCIIVKCVISRRSRPDVFCKKGVLRNFAKFIGKHLCQRLFFNKVAGFRPATLLKTRLWHRFFPVNFVKFLRTPFLTEHLRWLLLNIVESEKISFKFFFNNFECCELFQVGILAEYYCIP